MFNLCLLVITVLLQRQKITKLI